MEHPAPFIESPKIFNFFFKKGIDSYVIMWYNLGTVKKERGTQK
jgi:hypothetical protein